MRCIFLKMEMSPLEAKVGLLVLRSHQTKRETSNGWDIPLPPDALPAPVSRADLGGCVPGQKQQQQPALCKCFLNHGPAIAPL